MCGAAYVASLNQGPGVLELQMSLAWRSHHDVLTYLFTWSTGRNRPAADVTMSMQAHL